MTKPKAVSGALLLLDADVLYPIRVCDFILTAASLKLIARPVVSALILEEATRNIQADRPGPEHAARITRRFDAVRTIVDGFDQPIPNRFVDDSIVNPKDRHVLAAALHHGADFVVTNDARLGREITRWIEAHGHGRRLTAAFTADMVASRLLAESFTDVGAVVREMAGRFRNPPRSYAEVVASLGKSMPSLTALTEDENHQAEPDDDGELGPRPS